MKSLLGTLLFDKEMVDNLQAEKLDSNVLYTYLISGKITLKEYLSLI